MLLYRTIICKSRPKRKKMIRICFNLLQSPKNEVRSHMILFFGICLGFLTISAKALATEYYVSPSGNNNNAGTIDSPFKTISYGVNKLKAGDVLYVRAGTYVEIVYVGQSGTSSLPITIKAYPGESPVIDGKDELPATNNGYLLLLEGNYIHVSGFEVKNCNINGRYSGGIAISVVGRHNIVGQMNVHHSWENGIIASGDYSIVEDCRVWQCAFSNSINPGFPASGYWSTGISAARSQFDGITTDAILRRNIVYNNWGEGLSAFEAEGTLIEDNIVYDNWSVNLYISDTRDALIQRNLVYNSPNNIVGQRRPLTLGDELANKPRSANNRLINNLIYNADLWAFWSTGVPGSGLDNVLIANNTLVNGQLEIGASSADQAYNKSATISNNIFYTENGVPWEIKGSLANLIFSHNLWSSSPPSGLVGVGDVVGDPHLAKTGGTGAGELSAEYFKLRENSPAIDRGVIIVSVSSDFFGNLRINTPDMGAHEFNAATSSDEDEINHEDTQNVFITVDHSTLNIQLSETTPYRNIGIYNLQGVLVSKHNLSASIFSTDISCLLPGVYIIVLSGDRIKKEFKVMLIPDR